MTPDPIETLPDEVDKGERIFGAWFPPPTEEEVAAAMQTDDPAAALVPEPDNTDAWEKWAVAILAAGAASVALDAAKSTAWLLARRLLLTTTLTDTTRRGVQAQIDLDPSPAAIVRAYGIPATRINTLAADPTRAAALLAERWRLVSDGETTATYVAGAIEAAAQAVADGTLPPGTEIEWNARYTSNICEECGYLDGQKQPPGSPWIGMYGDEYAGPGWHPGCRCGLTVINGKPLQKISLTAPESVKAELRRGLAWHEEGHSGDGLVPATVAWARKLAEGGKISRDKAVAMNAWFARHESDKSGKGFSPGDGYPSPGRVAWALWGGDPAIGWSAKLKRFFEGSMKKAAYTAEQRKEMATKGEAMPDGSFPIANKADMKAAIRSIGRAADPAAAKKHIRARAKALGMEDMLGAAMQKSAGVALRKGYSSMPQHWCPSPTLELPIPCTPADLTPGMVAGYPVEMQAEFCALYNALAQPIPTGAGYPSEQAYYLTMDRLRQRGWCEAPGEQWYRVEAMGLPADYETDETGETMDIMGESSEEAPMLVEAQKALTVHLEKLRIDNAERVEAERLARQVAKAGRMISAENRKKLMDGHGKIMDGAAMIKDMIPAEDGGGEMPNEGIGKVSVIVKGDFAAVDGEQRVAFGFGVVATVNGKVVQDSQDDVIVDYASMEKAALVYAQSDRAGKLMHKGGVAYSVPFVVPMTNAIAKSLKMTTEKEGILIGMYFPNTPEGDAGWQLAKNGGGFSVGGKGERSPMT